MFLRLRQICLVARELEPRGRELCETFGLQIAIRDPAVEKHGLNNVVMPVGTTFLEVVSPFRENTAGGRYLDRLGADGGYMVILDCGDLDAMKAQVLSTGVRIAYEGNYPEKGYRALHLHPKDAGGTLLSIDRDEAGDELTGAWNPAGADWTAYVRTSRVKVIVGAELRSADPQALAARWGRILARPVIDGDRIALDNAVLRFVKSADGSGDTLGGVDLAVTDRAAVLAAARSRGMVVEGDAVRACGVRFRLVDAA